MSYRFAVAPRAASQIRAAARWWKQNRPKAPSALVDDLESAYELIASLPNAGEQVSHPTNPGLRRLYLGRVRYHLYYSVDHDSRIVEVLALWHASRGSAPPI